jgi:hypothetical protein
VDDFGTRLLRRPGETGGRVSIGGREFVGQIARRRGILLAVAKIGQAQLCTDAGEHLVTDEFDR